MFLDLHCQRVQNIVLPLFYHIRTIPYDMLPHGPELSESYYLVIDNSHLFSVLAHTPYYNAVRHEMLVQCYSELMFHVSKIISLLSLEVIKLYLPTHH